MCMATNDHVWVRGGGHLLNSNDAEAPRKDPCYRWNHNCVRLCRRNCRSECTNIEVDQKSKLVVLTHVSRVNIISRSNIRLRLRLTYLQALIV